MSEEGGWRNVWLVLQRSIVRCLRFTCICLSFIAAGHILNKILNSVCTARELVLILSYGVTGEIRLWV